MSSGPYEIECCIRASATPGDENNFVITQIQVNYSDPKRGLAESLKGKGKTHVDRMDDKHYLLVVWFMSNLDEDDYPGRFTVASARHPHFSSPAMAYADGIERDSPLRYQAPNVPFEDLPATAHRKQRTIIVVYPNADAMKADTKQLRPEVRTRMEFCGTKHNMAQLQMLGYIKENIAEIRKFDEPLDQIIDDILELLSWENKQAEVEVPRRRLAELAIKWNGTTSVEWDDIGKANLAFGCGSTFPGTEKSTRGVERGASRKARKKVGATHAPCQAICSRGKKCKRSYYIGEGTTVCHNHREPIVSVEDIEEEEEGAKEFEGFC